MLVSMGTFNIGYTNRTYLVYTLSVKKFYTNIQLYITISVKIFDITIYYLKSLTNTNI